MHWEGKMLKKIGFTTAALFGLLLMGSARPAKAEVHFGIYLGAPAYTYPVDPYAYSYPYGYSGPAYVYRQPAYVAPYAYGYTYRNRDRRDYRDRDRQRGYQFNQRNEHGRRR